MSIIIINRTNSIHQTKAGQTFIRRITNRIKYNRISIQFFDSLFIDKAKRWWSNEDRANKAQTNETSFHNKVLYGEHEHARCQYATVLFRFNELISIQSNTHMNERTICSSLLSLVRKINMAAAAVTGR